MSSLVLRGEVRRWRLSIHQIIVSVDCVFVVWAPEQTVQFECITRLFVWQQRLTTLHVNISWFAFQFQSKETFSCQCSHVDAVKCHLTMLTKASVTTVIPYYRPVSRDPRGGEERNVDDGCFCHLRFFLSISRWGTSSLHLLYEMCYRN